MTAERPLTVAKTRVDEIIDADHRLTHLVYAYLACATVWLVFGTLVGEYLGLKFAWPDLGGRWPHGEVQQLHRDQLGHTSDSELQTLSRLLEKARAEA